MSVCHNQATLVFHKHHEYLLVYVDLAKLWFGFYLKWFLHSTVEPPNKGHFGSRHFVLYREAVL